MVKVMPAPVQDNAVPVKIGVTVMVAVIGPVVALAVVNVGKLPVPLAPRPMAVLLLVQLKVVPGTVDVNAGGVTELPLQYAKFA